MSDCITKKHEQQQQHESVFKWHRLSRLNISNLQYVARLLPLGICCLRISATECSQANQPLVLGQPFKSTIASCAITISATMHSNHPHSYCSDKLPALCLWWQHVIWTKEWILKANEVKVDFLVLLDGSEDQGGGGVILEQSMELGIHPIDEKVFEAWVGSTPCAWSTHTPWDEFQNFNNC